MLWGKQDVNQFAACIISFSKTGSLRVVYRLQSKSVVLCSTVTSCGLLGFKFDQTENYGGGDGAELTIKNDGVENFVVGGIRVYNRSMDEEEQMVGTFFGWV